MDSAFDEENGPLSSDIGYDEAMAKLNASLKRSSSLSRKSMANAGSSSNSRGSLEGPPHYIFGVGTGSTSSKENAMYLHDVDVDEYGSGSQLPSIEEARTTAASALSRAERASQRCSNGRFPFENHDDDDDYNDQYNKFLPFKGKLNSRDVNENLASNKRKKNWYKFAFFILIAAVLGTVIGLVVGFTAGEEVEKLNEKAASSGNNGNSGATTAPRPTSAPAPTNPPATPTANPPGENPLQTTPVPTSTPAVIPTSSDPPTPSPTHKIRVHDVFKWLTDQGIAKQTDFADENSHQYHAAHWIADGDQAALEIPTTIGQPDAYHFIERYVMALLYFSTGGKSWSFNFRFFSSDSVCKWNVDVTLPDSRKIQIGVVCDGTDGRIVSLNISQNNLVGTIVTELGLLSNLNFLAFNHNVLGGTIPKELGDLTRLSYLALHYNELKGKLPTWIQNFESLRVLGLGDNHLTGSIPTEWASLLNVRTLGIDNNQLTGNLSPLEGYAVLERAYLEENKFSQDLAAFDWSKMSNLQELDLSSNEIGGTLPDELLGLPNLCVLDLGSNQIDGTLKDFSENRPSSLKYLGLHNNQIGGLIPTSIAYLNNLTHLDLSENAFTDLIPSQMGYLTNLQYFFIADNENLRAHIIPPFIGLLTNLRDLSLKGTRRFATIKPNLLSNLTKLVLLDLGNNLLSGNIPSEIGALSTLTYLLLNGNNVDGMVPTEIQLLPNLDIFLIDRNELVGNLTIMCTKRQRKPDISGADCSGDAPEIICECCNICCEDDVNSTDCRDRVYFGQLDPVWENSYQRRYYQFADEDFGHNDEKEFDVTNNNVGDDEVNDIGTGDQLGTGTNTTLNNAIFNNSGA